MKAMIQSAMPAALRAGATAARSGSAKALERTLVVGRQPQAQSLTALVRQAQLVTRWEDRLWLVIGFTSFALIVLSFAL